MERLPLNESQALAMLNQKVSVDGYQPERAAQERLMMRAMAFYGGKQHIQERNGLLVELPYESDLEVRYRANIIMPAIERAVSKVMAASGDMRVAPADGSPKARRKAKLSDKVLKHINLASDYDDAREEALKWSAIVGTGYVRTTWNPNLGDKQRYYYQDGQTVLPANQDEAFELERQGAFEELAMGDVEFSAFGPFTIHHDWNSRKGVKECLWMAEHSLVSIPTLAEHFQLKEADIPATGQVPGSAIYEESLAFMTSGAHDTAGYGYVPQQQEKEGRALLTVMYHRPTAKYPKGLYVVRIGQQIVMLRDNPYRDAADGIPFTKYDWNKMPGRYLGFGLAEQAMSSQVQYNRARGKMTEFQDVWGQPAIFVEDGSGIDTDNFVLQPGAVYSIARGFKVHAQQPPAFPPEVAQNASIAKQEVAEITGQNDPESGKLPGQMRSGAALAQFFQEKNRPLSTPAMHAVKGDRDNGRIALKLARQNYQEERLIKIAGPGGTFDVAALRGSDIHYDLRIIGQPKDLDSLQVAKAEMMDLIQLGAIDPQNPQHWRALVQTFHWNTTDEAFNDWTMDQRNQEDEIERILLDPAAYSEQPYPVAEFEDHEVHAETLARYMKGEEFRALDPMSQSAIYTHFQLHMQEIQKAMQQQAEMIEAAKGAPGQKGEASQPANRS